MTKSVYIHIPFCNTICSYCDFCKLIYNKEWIDKYLNELEKEITKNYKGETLKTIYIGGGTPTSLNIEELKKLLNICKIFNLDKTYEFTIEANIENIDEEKIKLMKEYNVNRISLGVQTFNDEILKTIKRHHTKIEVIEKIKMIKKYFDNINIDLMYAFSNESMDILKEDINYLLEFDINHISTYSLIIEPNTELYIKDYKNIDEDIDFEMYKYIETTLEQNNYIHYETSNYAKLGYESKHNLTYWNNDEYYGFGLGASGYINNIRYENTRSLNNYLKGVYIKEQHELSNLEDMQNYVILGLRKIKGISLIEFEKRYNKKLEDVFDIKELLNDKKIEIKNNYLSINKDYIYLANEILINFI